MLSGGQYQDQMQIVFDTGMVKLVSAQLALGGCCCVEDLTQMHHAPAAAATTCNGFATAFGCRVLV